MPIRKVGRSAACSTWAGKWATGDIGLSVALEGEPVVTFLAVGGDPFPRTRCRSHAFVGDVPRPNTRATSCGPRRARPGWRASSVGNGSPWSTPTRSSTSTRGSRRAWRGSHVSGTFERTCPHGRPHSGRCSRASWPPSPARSSPCPTRFIGRCSWRGAIETPKVSVIHDAGPDPGVRLMSVSTAPRSVRSSACQTVALLVVLVSKLVELKGHEVLIRAIPQVTTHVPPDTLRHRGP